jgi:hypothetical protein
MKYPASPDHIKVFDNFIEPDDLKVLDRLCRNATAFDDWYGQKSCPSEEYIECAIGAYKERCIEYRSQTASSKYSLILSKYSKRITEMISYEAGHRLVPMFDLCRMETADGGYCPGHTDAEGLGPHGSSYMPEYSPFHIYEPNIIDMSVNIYVNNDFEGGQLHFPKFGITVEHTPGQLVWFPGSAEYEHGVHKIKGNPRWNIITHYARPKLIEMHSIIHNMFSEMTDEQRRKFPEEYVTDQIARGLQGKY